MKHKTVVAPADLVTDTLWNEEHVDIWSGKDSFVGDGSSTAFVIPHGRGTTPSFCIVGANSAAAAADKHWAVDATNITVTFLSPPDSDASIELWWRAL